MTFRIQTKIAPLICIAGLAMATNLNAQQFDEPSDCPGQRIKEDKGTRIRHHSWKNKRPWYFLWYYKKFAGSRILAEKRGKRRRFWCFWICKTGAWKKTKPNHLFMTGSLYLDGQLAATILTAPIVKDRIRVGGGFSIFFGIRVDPGSKVPVRPVFGGPFESFSFNGIRTIASGSVSTVHYDDGCTQAGATPPR